MQRLFQAMQWEQRLKQAKHLLHRRALKARSVRHRCCLPPLPPADPPLSRTCPCTCRTIEEHRQRSGTNELPKVLGVWDMTFLGLGSIIGAGVFVLSGVAAAELAG